MHTLRARFGKDIIAEFLAPVRPSSKAIIFCDGMPTVPAKKSLLQFYAKKGYWVFHPRYRGSWESSGLFMKQTPHFDVLSLIDWFSKGFVSEWDRKKYKFEPNKIIIVGASFGGTAALLCTQDKRVDKVIAISPVVDWRSESKIEPISWVFKTVGKAFGQAYRIDKQAVRKLKSGKFFNPVFEMEKLPGNKF